MFYQNDAYGKRAAGSGKPLSRDGLIAGLEGISDQSHGGFSVNFGPIQHVASSYVDLSRLMGDGRVRT